MYIKSYHNQDLGIKEVNVLTERVWSPGYTVPDERVCSRQPNLHKDVGILSRGEYSDKPTC